MAIIETKEEVKEVRIHRVYACDMPGCRHRTDYAASMHACIVCGRLMCWKHCQGITIDSEGDNTTHAYLCKEHITEDNVSTLSTYRDTIYRYRESVIKERDDEIVKRFKALLTLMESRNKKK